MSNPAPDKEAEVTMDSLPILPQFSILVPVHNTAPYLEQLLRSVVDQNRTDIELVTVDDGSNDGSGDILDEWHKRYPWILVTHKPNGGCASALNAALMMASGDFVVIMGSDDYYLPSCFTEQDTFIQTHPGFDLYTYNALNLYPDKSLGPYRSSRHQDEVVSYVLDDWFESCPIYGGAFVRREAVLAVSGYREDLENAEDYDLWLRLMASGVQHIHNPAYLAVYRRHGGSKSAHRSRAAWAVLHILEDFSQTESLSESQQARLHCVIERRRSAAQRRELEERLIAGDYSRARLDFLRTVGGYANKWKLIPALLLVSVSPRLYAALILRRDRKVPLIGSQ